MSRQEIHITQFDYDKSLKKLQDLFRMYKPTINEDKRFKEADGHNLTLAYGTDHALGRWFDIYDNNANILIFERCQFFNGKPSIHYIEAYNILLALKAINNGNQ